MLTQREFQHYCGVLRHPCLSYVIPYDFFRIQSTNNPKINLCPTISVLKQRFVIFQLWLCALYTGFSGVRMGYITMIFIKNKMDSDLVVNLEDLLLGYFFLLVRISHLLVPLTLAKSGLQFAQFVNQQHELDTTMGKFKILNSDCNL